MDIRQKKGTKIAFVLVLVLAIILQSFTMPGITKAVVTSDLKATIYSSTMISINWNDYLTDEKRYIIDKKVDSGVFTDLYWSSTNTTSYTDNNVAAGHTYTYRIRATDSTNVTYSYTEELTFRTDEVDKPNSLLVTPVTYNQIDLKWTYANQKAYNTIIERRAENETNWYQIANIGIGQNTYSDKTISSGVKYYYKVRAVSTDKVKTTAYPDEYTGNGAYSLLYKPTDLYGFALSQYQIQLTWKDNSVETAFIIERRSPDEGVFKEIAVAPQNTNTYIDSDTSLKPGLIYAYRVKAVTGATSSEYSDVFSVTSTFLRTPGVLSSSCVDGQSIKLVWQDLTDGETGFEVWRKTGTSPVWELQETMGRNSNTFTDLAVSPEVTYSYKVRAKINDNSVYSDFSNETTVWTSTISAPTNLTYEIISKTEIILNWQDTSNVEAGFKVERKIGLSGQWYEIAHLEPGTIKFNDKWLNSTEINCYRIKAFDRSNAVSYSNEILVSTETPEAPTNLQTNAISSSEVELKWQDNSNNENEFIIESKQFYSFKEVGRVSADTTSFIQKNINPNKTLTFRVKAVNGSNQSAASNEAIATTKKELTYSDLTKVTWAKTAINNLASRNVFDAKANTKFYPEQNITIGEYCAILIRGLELRKVASGKFADVTSKHKYYKEIMTASKLGIVSVDDNNKIYPDKLITREQAGLMIFLALKNKETPLPEENSSTLKQFADYKSVSTVVAGKIAAVCGAGLLTGRITNGRAYLQLKSNLTRAEAAVMAYKAINLK